MRDSERHAAGVIGGQRGSVCSPACKVILPPPSFLYSGGVAWCVGVYPRGTRAHAWSATRVTCLLNCVGGSGGHSTVTGYCCCCSQRLDAVVGMGQTQAATASGERVLVGDRLPAIHKRLLTKIRNWEYVDLTELLPAADVSVDAENNGPLAARFPLFPDCAP